MGRIKTQLIKRSAMKLYKMYKPECTQEFGKNKALVNAKVTINKKTRNAVAGYITRVTKMEAQGKIIR